MATGILNNGDYSIEDDSNGNLIVTDANDNTVLTYNDSAGQWELGTLDATTLNTERSRIGTVDNKGKTYRLIDRRAPSSGTTTVQFSSLNNNTEYKIYLNCGMSTNGADIYLRLNGDGSSTGNYDYWDASGTEQTGQNEFLLASFTNGANMETNIHVDNASLGGNGHSGIRNRIMPSFTSRISDFGREGGRVVSEALSSVELTFQDGINDSSVIELWERDYA